MHWKCGLRIFEIWEKAGSWVPASEQESRDSELGEARWICVLRALRIGWVESWRCKSSQHRKIVSLSSHVEKPLNSKRWIKVLYLNQFRECCVFRIPYVYFTHPYTWLCNTPQVRVNLGVITMKEYTTFPKASGLELHHQMQLSVIPRTLVLFDP